MEIWWLGKCLWEKQGEGMNQEQYEIIKIVTNKVDNVENIYQFTKGAKRWIK